MRKLSAACLLLLGCGGAMPTSDGSLGDASSEAGSGTLLAPQPFAVHSVSFPQSTMLPGDLTAVEDSAGYVLALSRNAAQLFNGEGLTPLDTTPMRAWARGGSGPSAISAGRWQFAIDGMGGLWRVREALALESVGARYGVDRDRVESVAYDGSRYLGIALASSLALANGDTVERYMPLAMRGLAGSQGRLAGVTDTGLAIVDTSGMTWARAELPGARSVAFDNSGRIYALAGDWIYAETDDGTLQPRFHGAPGSLHGLARSAGRVWFGNGAGLCVLEGVQTLTLSCTVGNLLPTDAALFGSESTGDVWAVASGHLQRFAADRDSSASAVFWNASVRPIFSRRCANCHQPGGPSYAGYDFTSFASWYASRSLLQMRTVGTSSSPMPPANSPTGALTAAESNTLRMWFAMP